MIAGAPVLREPAGERILQFQPFEAEMRRFAEHVLPRVRTGIPS